MSAAFQLKLMAKKRAVPEYYMRLWNNGDPASMNSGLTEEVEVAAVKIKEKYGVEFSEETKSNIQKLVGNLYELRLQDVKKPEEL